MKLLGVFAFALLEVFCIVWWICSWRLLSTALTWVIKHCGGRGGSVRGKTEKLLPGQHNLWNLHKSRTLVQTADYPFALGRCSAESPSIYWWDKMALCCSSRQYWLDFLFHCVAVALLSVCHVLSISLCFFSIRTCGWPMSGRGLDWWLAHADRRIRVGGRGPFLVGSVGVFVCFALK